MSDKRPPEDTEETDHPTTTTPYQLELVASAEPFEEEVEEEEEEEEDQNGLVPDDDTSDGDDNVVLLPGLHPEDTLGWAELAEEAEEEDPREGLPDIDDLVPPSEEMLDGVVEALLLTASGPMTIQQLNTHLASPGVPPVRDAVHRVAARFKRGGGGIRVVEVAKGWQLRTDIRCAPWVASMRGQTPLKLSKAALETLAIVAYRQPVSRAEVEDLRGVDPGGILRMLCERGLICVAGRKDAPGRPLLYGTTNDFLSLFGLRDLSDLPTLRDLRELQQDDPREGIGNTAADLEADLMDALKFTSKEKEESAPDEHSDMLTILPALQEVLPLQPTDHGD